MMLNLHNIVGKTQMLLRSNATPILTAMGVSGTLTTAYLAAKASFRAARVIDREEERGIQDPFDNTPPQTRQELIKSRTKLVWRFYIPATVSGTLTVGCIIWGAKVGTKRAAAAYSLLTVSEKAFTEYKEKVVEQLGEKKEQAIRDEIAQDRVRGDSTQGMILVGPGNVLCYEMHTGRYFMSDMESLRKAQNTINAKLINEMDATVSDFYYLVRLPYTSNSSVTGWTSDKMLELHFSTVLSDDGRPCIAFDYNYVIPFG